MLLAAASIAGAAVPQFDIGVETLRIPATAAVQPTGAGAVTEWTILGKFYPQDARPVIRAHDTVAEPGQPPFTLLAELLRVAPSGGETAMRTLYAPESQAIIAGFAADPELRQQQSKWLESLQSFTVLGGWAEKPDRYVLYTRVNGAAAGVTPFLFQRSGNRWYLQAGSLNAPPSVWLDAVYFSPVEPQIEIISPAAPEAVRTLLAEDGMAALAAELGLASPARGSDAVGE